MEGAGAPERRSRAGVAGGAGRAGVRNGCVSLDVRVRCERYGLLSFRLGWGCALGGFVNVAEKFNSLSGASRSPS